MLQGTLYTDGISVGVSIFEKSKNQYALIADD
jgi:hypothetical protein